MSKKACETCYHWQFVSNNLGICSASLPLVGPLREISIEAVAAATYWPVTHGHQRCGHWRASEHNAEAIAELINSMITEGTSVEIYGHAGHYRACYRGHIGDGVSIEEAIMRVRVLVSP